MPFDSASSYPRKEAWWWLRRGAKFSSTSRVSQGLRYGQQTFCSRLFGLMIAYLSPYLMLSQVIAWYLLSERSNGWLSREFKTILMKSFLCLTGQLQPEIAWSRVYLRVPRPSFWCTAHIESKTALGTRPASFLGNTLNFPKTISHFN